MSSEDHQVPIKGVIDNLASGILTGWVFDASLPMQSQPFFVEVDNQIVTDAIAHCFRQDLVEHGFASGRHGFYVDLELTYKQVAGKLIRLLDKHQKPIIGAEYLVKEAACLVSFQLLSRQAHQFEFSVSCSNALEETQLTLRYGEACIALESVAFPAGNSTETIAIPLGVLDGFNDTFAVELAGFPAPVWLSKQLSPAPDQAGMVADCVDLSTSCFVAQERHETLDFHLKKTLNKQQLDDTLSAYRYLLGKREDVCLKHANKHDIDVSIFIVFDDGAAIDRLLHSLASMIFAYSEYSFELIFVTTLEQKTLLVEALACHEVACDYVCVADLNSFGALFSSLGRTARGQYSVIVNQPVEVLSDWLDELITPFEQTVHLPDVTTVQTISAKGEVLAPATFLDINGFYWSTEQKLDASHPSVSYVRKDYRKEVSVWCVRSSLLLDATGEDNELCKLASLNINSLSSGRATGLNVVYIPQSKVISITPLDKTKSVIAAHQEVKKKSILLIDHALPSINEDAGSYAAVQEIKLIQSLGYKVIFVAARIAPFSDKVEFLQRLGVEVVYRPFFTSFDSVIHHYIDDLCAVYITRYNVAEQVIPVIKRVNSLLPIIFNNADLHFLRELREALNSRDPQRVQHAMITRDAELSVMQQVDAILSYTDTEHAVITSHLFESEKIHTCPWVLEEKSEGLPFENRQGIAFLGGYRHTPNVEAVTFFVENVIPLLAEKAPEIVFYVYGSHMPEGFEPLACANVRLIGFVENLDDLYHQHRIFVAPLLSGAGIKGKVLESLAYGLPTVLSSVAAEGIGLTHNITTLLAETPEEWCDEIIRLYHNESLWQRISQNQKIVVQDKFSFSAGKKKMQTIFSSVGLE